MKRLRFVFLLLAFSTLLFPLNQTPVSPAAFELAHDDGGFDYGWSDFYPSGAMVRFSPPSPSWRIKNVREFKTWYEDACYNFGDHAKGVAGCEMGVAILLEKYKDSFGIEGDIIIDRKGHNVYPYISDSFTGNIEKKVINWWGEWKSIYKEEEDISSALNRAIYEFVIKGKQGPRVEAALKENINFPEYGYAFAIKITENYVKVAWEKVEIPQS